MSNEHQNMQDVESLVGDAPPLTPDMRPSATTPKAHRISLRWLGTTMLTGLASGILLTGALYIAFDRQTHFAANAASTTFESQNAESETSGPATKADKLFQPSRQAATRNIIHESTVSQLEGGEFIGVKPYVMISAGMEASIGELQDQIPAFDPVRLYSTAAANNNEPEPEIDDQSRTSGQITQNTIDLLPVLVSENVPPSTIDRDELARTHAGLPDAGESAIQGLDGLTRARLAQQAFGNTLGAGISEDDAGFFDLATLQPTDMTNNVSVLPKRAMPMRFDDAQQLSVTASAGDTLSAILVRHGCTSDEAADIIRALGMANGPLRAGKPIDMLLAPDSTDPNRMRPVHVTIQRDDARQISVALAHTGRFVPLSMVDTSGALRSTLDTSTEASGQRPTVFQSLYATGMRNDIPRPMIENLVRIFAFDVDFQRRVSPEDSIEIFFADPQANGANAANGTNGNGNGSAANGSDGNTDQAADMLYAAITLQGERHEFYRFRTSDDGIVDYYKPDGQSAKRFLIRKPLRSGVFRSGFGMRRHPILGYRRMHKGVDWAAPRGTPIFAAGNGVVIEAERKSGYGNWIKIRHANGYETSYAHQTRFAKGIREGVRVRLGQIIGYVGSTGLSTGPHLHYEVTVNGRHVNPMRIRLPRGRSLSGEVLAEFEAERSRIDALRNTPPVSTRLATAGQ
jgi:murein DD-endopeptidase MepM/ murein hydrolase activator NlpD